MWRRSGSLAPTMDTPIAVTGTTGKLGSRVAEVLAARGVPQLLVGRDLARLPDLPGAQARGPAAYDDHDAMARACAGAGTLLLVSASLSGRRLAEHAAAFAAAVDAGVSRLVYVSLLGAGRAATYRNARDHAETEEHLAGLGVPWTVLRAGYYASMLPGMADAAGALHGPAGDGRVAYVSHDDIAVVAADVLLDTSGSYDGATLEVTGAEALDFADVAARLTAWSGRPHEYRPEDPPSYRRRLLDSGYTEHQADDWVSWYVSVADGSAAARTSVVLDVTGHQALPVEQSWNAR